MRTTLLLLCVITFSCKTKEVDKIISNEAYVNEVKKVFVKERPHNIDSILTKLTSINLPYSSNRIISKVKYYDNVGGFLVDTTFTGIGISTLFTYLLDSEKPLLGLNKKVLEVNINEQKSNIIEEDGVKFAYNNNEDYNYNVKSQILFPVFKKELENFILIGSYSQYLGENDIPGVFFTLTSFDKKGNQLDYLIVFNRFSWETLLEKDFTIKENIGVTITKKVIEYFDEDLENERETPIITKKTQYYVLNEKGIFQKIESSK